MEFNEQDKRFFELLITMTPMVSLIKNTNNVYEYNLHCANNLLTEEEYTFAKQYIKDKNL